MEKEGYTVTIPDLPGCVTEGNSLLHAIEMGIEAASGWILGELEEGYGEKAVRKNITIPAWLNTYGEKNHINFSKVLQDALLEKAQSQK